MEEVEEKGEKWRSNGGDPPDREMAAEQAFGTNPLPRLDRFTFKVWFVGEDRQRDGEDRQRDGEDRERDGEARDLCLVTGRVRGYVHVHVRISESTDRDCIDFAFLSQALYNRTPTFPFAT